LEFKSNLNNAETMLFLSVQLEQIGVDEKKSRTFGKEKNFLATCKNFIVWPLFCIILVGFNALECRFTSL